MEVVRGRGTNAEAWRDRLIWVDKAEDADARVVLSADSIVWLAKGESRPRFVLQADPRLHAFDGGLREHWAQALGQVFLSRLLLYSAAASKNSPVEMKSGPRRTDSMVFVLTNSSPVPQAVEAFLIDRAYTVVSRRVEPLAPGSGVDLNWPLKTGDEPLFLVIRSSHDSTHSYAVLPIHSGAPAGSEWKVTP